jgi:hypothetical protein
LKELVVQLPTPYILTSDFNAHNQIWGSTTADQSGRETEALISADQEITLLNTGSPTRFNIYNGSTSSIDLSFCSSSLSHALAWHTSSELYSSDHFPQIISFPLVTSSSASSYSRWILSKACWTNFTEAANLEPIKKCSTVDDMNEKMTQIIMEAALQNIPKTSNNFTR